MAWHLLNYLPLKNFDLKMMKDVLTQLYAVDFYLCVKLQSVVIEVDQKMVDFQFLMFHQGFTWLDHLVVEVL